MVEEEEEEEEEEDAAPEEKVLVDDAALEYSPCAKMPAASCVFLASLEGATIAAAAASSALTVRLPFPFSDIFADCLRSVASRKGNK